MPDEQVAGSTLLTEAPSGVGNPPPMTLTPQNGVDAAIQAAADGPPEYIPAKFWDGEKKQVRMEDLGRGYINIEKLISREKVPVPTSDDDTEGWDRWEAATRVASPDDYAFTRPTMPDDLPYDEDGEKYLRSLLQASGVPKRQASKLYDGITKLQVERHGAWAQHQKQAKGETLAKLQREHGQQYDQAMGNARVVMQQYGDPEFRAYLDESGMGNDPRLIRIFARIGKDISGDTMLKGAPSPGGEPADIDKALSDHMEQHKAVLMKADHPDYQRRNAERIELLRKRWGD